MAAERKTLRVVVVTNAKGGCGKTTLATTLAAAAAASGARAALADADPHRGALDWLARRGREARPIRALDWTRRGAVERRFREARALGLEWLIIDLPPLELGAASSRGYWAIANRATAVLTPVTPSFFDERATRQFLSLIENAPAVRRHGADLILAANRVRARGRASLRRELDCFFETCGVEPATVLTDRAAYPKLSRLGASIFDDGSLALAPLRAQWRPILDRLGIAAPVERSADCRKSAARKTAARSGGAALIAA